jgi:hypothetical protein
VIEHGFLTASKIKMQLLNGKSLIGTAEYWSDGNSRKCKLFQGNLIEDGLSANFSQPLNKINRIEFIQQNKTVDIVTKDGTKYSGVKNPSYKREGIWKKYYSITENYIPLRKENGNVDYKIDFNKIKSIKINGKKKPNPGETLGTEMPFGSVYLKDGRTIKGCIMLYWYDKLFGYTKYYDFDAQYVSDFYDIKEIEIVEN